MQVGDLVKHKYGTLQGTGIVLDEFYEKRRYVVRALWTTHGHTQEWKVATEYLEVVNESR